MRETFLEYKGKGFWIRSKFVEIVSEHICQAFENLGLAKFNEKLLDIYSDCDSNRNGEKSYGVVNILFDDSVVTEDDKNAFLNICSKAKQLIAAKGQELSVPTLNAWEQQKLVTYERYIWSVPIKTESLKKTIELVEQLINETYPFSNHYINYMGFPADEPQDIL